MRAHLALAAFLVAEEALIGSGIGIVAFPSGVILLAVYLWKDRTNRKMLVLAAMYAIAGIASVAVIQINWRLAETRSQPVIAACKKFHTKYERYPTQLDELVPEFMPAVPHAGYTLISRRFHYFPSRPAIGFAVMFHGVTSYDFQENKWQTNE